MKNHVKTVLLLIGCLSAAMASDATAASFDGDNSNGSILVGRADGYVTWVKRSGNTLAGIASQWVTPMSEIAVGDINGNGNGDVVTANTDGYVRWEERSGSTLADQSSLYLTAPVTIDMANGVFVAGRSDGNAHLGSYSGATLTDLGVGAIRQPLKLRIGDADGNSATTDVWDLSTGGWDGYVTTYQRSGNSLTAVAGIYTGTGVAIATGTLDTSGYGCAIVARADGYITWIASDGANLTAKSTVLAKSGGGLLDVAMGHVNGSVNGDVVVLRDDGYVSWFTSDGSSLTAVGSEFVGATAVSICLGDLDGDGVNDLVVGRSDGRVMWYKVAGTSFTYVADYWTTAVVNVKIASIPAAPTTPVLVQNYQAAVTATPGLISYYKFDGGTVNDDFGPNNMNPSWTGFSAATYAAGVGGGSDQALTFDGSGNGVPYVGNPGDSPFNFASGQGTVELWLKAGWATYTAPNDFGPSIFSDKWLQRVYFASLSTDKTTITVWNTETTTPKHFTLPTAAGTNWHHLAVVFNTNSSVTVIWDGLNLGTQAFILGTSYGASTFTLGGFTFYDPASYAPWVGELDEVAVYSNAVPLGSLQAHYGVLVTNTPPPPPSTVFDDINSPSVWTGPIYQYGFPSTGSAAVSNGILTVVHTPTVEHPYHGVSMKRTWFAPFRPNTWFHFQFRIKEMLLGADMYATLTVNGSILLQMGVNGEQHWVRGGYCTPKTYEDDFFWGSDVIVGQSSGKKHDMRTALPVALTNTVQYTNWTLVSMKYEVIGSERLLRLFINGQEIGYQDADLVAAIDNHVISAFDPGTNSANISVEFMNTTDGDYYGDTNSNGGLGIRLLHAFADNTPALPHPTDPALAIKKNSEMQWDYLMMVDPADKSSVLPQLAADGVQGNGQFQLRLAGAPGDTNVLFASTNLTSWAAVQTNLVANPVWIFTDPATSNLKERFYRVQPAP